MKQAWLVRAAFSAAAVMSMSQGNSLAAQDKSSKAQFDWVSSEGRDLESSAFPSRPGTYRNPIIPGFHPDPSIARVGPDYYLVNSSFSYWPGLPIFHSRDLVHWKLISHALAGADFPRFKGAGISRGLFAPTLRYHQGMFYLINTVIDKGGTFVITAKDPRGPWTAPKWIPSVQGIDPDLFFDDNGALWIAYNGGPQGTPRYDGHRAIWLQQISPKTWEPIGAAKLLVDGGVHPEQNPIWTEGPHIIKRGDHYYLFTAEGGTGGDHSETVYRADKVTGPYTAAPDNPILTQRDLPADRAYPVTASGHADLTQTADGRWWAVFLAARPYQANLSNMGRETFMLPVEWSGDWPKILPPKTPVPFVVTAPQSQGPAFTPQLTWTDTFAQSKLDPEWLTLRSDEVTYQTGKGLVITPNAAPLGAMGTPSFIARRQSHAVETVSTQVRLDALGRNDAAGLAVFADENHFFTITAMRSGKGSSVRITRRMNADDAINGAVIGQAQLPAMPVATPLRLRLALNGGKISFAYATGPKWRWQAISAPDDASGLASERSNQFTGTVIGPIATAGN